MTSLLGKSALRFGGGGQHLDRLQKNFAVSQDRLGFREAALAAGSHSDFSD